MNANGFWLRLPHVLQEAELLSEDDAAELLVNFLEGYRHAWPAIAATMHNSAGRRALVERSVRILAEQDLVDDGIPN